MPRRRPWAQPRDGHRHRTAWAADDRRQVEELMVRWRHNVPALKWERLARHSGRTAAALRAWVWRNRASRWRRHSWTESQLRRIRRSGTSASRGRMERPEDRESRRAHVGAPLGGLGLHAGVPNGPARSAAARRPRGESSGSAGAPGPHHALRMKLSKRVLRLLRLHQI